ncbi:hypothetical protein F5887DRAFT_189133 [Amanita rubescens]|nr:hypothetical protein F5887DRAFT_189133 [Amanita rubescens]
MLPVPTCFPLDLMHLCSLNIPQHLLATWRNSSETKIVFNQNNKPSFIVLHKPDVWKAHGKLVESMRPYLPTSFGRPPRNPALKINSGYKACEFQIYFWILGPAVFRLVLPNALWRNFCKLVRATRVIHQRIITREQIEDVHRLLLDWETEFELQYYSCNIERLHLIRPCIHAMVHVAQETARCGPLHLLAQWVLENTIGNLGREVRQPSNAFANLAERGLIRAQQNALRAIIPDSDGHLPNGAMPLDNGFALLRARQKKPQRLQCEAEVAALRIYYLNSRGIDESQVTEDERQVIEGEWQVIEAHLRIQKWARLLLPNRQEVRSAWKDGRRSDGRNSRNVKLQLNSKTVFGEVQYYFMWQIQEEAPVHPLAMIYLYSDPIPGLLEDSFETLHVCKYLGSLSIAVVDVRVIQSLVAMIPFPLSEQEAPDARLSNTFFVGEKLALQENGQPTSDDLEDDEDEVDG